jgi:hypothetical protein
MSVAWEENTAAINETQQFSVDPVTNLKVKTAVAGLQLSIQRYLLGFPTERDRELVADFLITCVQ